MKNYKEIKIALSIAVAVMVMPVTASAHFITGPITMKLVNSKLATESFELSPLLAVKSIATTTQDRAQTIKELQAKLSYLQSVLLSLTR